MKALEAIQVVNELAASQRGLFTAAQAQAAGVGRVSLARLADRGQIERVYHGVYRAGGAPSARTEDVLAAWMGLVPDVPSYLRDKGPGGFTASLNTAAWLQDIGELGPVPITFSHPARRQTRQQGLSFIRRGLAPEDVAVVSGIPATTAFRTVLDLIDFGEDLSLVASVLNDAIGSGLVEDGPRITSEVDARSKARGLGPGFPLYDYLRRQ